jgi:predicted AlkP superfamily pyrophosphatase or phosphodiesterase
VNLKSFQRILAPAAVLALLLAGSARPAFAQRRAAASDSTAATTAPALIVFFTVDQMRPDYQTRFESQLTGGLARLYHGGAVFTNAFQDHAITQTAPGHSATLSGRFPYSTGILRNSAGVADRQAPLIDAKGTGASPFRFRGSTLFDWLRQADPRSRALSVSRKDRGAILPVGRQPQQVYWYSSEGKFTTSTWYGDTLPAWVNEFNARDLPRSFAGKSWKLLLPASEYPEPDGLEEGSASGNVLFPHDMPADSAKAAAALAEFPWMDELVFEMALAGVNALELGAGPQTDLLAVSLSTTDAIGHAYGPDSREIHDQIIRLDREMGAFLDSLYKIRDSATIVVALTADHGVTSYPLVRQELGRGKAVFYGGAKESRDFVSAVRERGVPRSAISYSDGVLFLDREAFAAAGVNADSVVTAFIKLARGFAGVLRVDRMSDIARADTAKDAIARRWLHSIPREMPAQVVVTMQPFAYPLGTKSAHHGSPSDADAHVPMIFYGPPFAPGRYDAFARVVDLAPTLAKIAHVPPLERLDGHVLTAAIK